MSQTRRFGRRLCSRELAPERLRLHVVGADALAVDLDDGDQLAITRLQLGVALDRDLDQLEPELGAKLGELGLRPLAKVAALGLIEDDLRRLRLLGPTQLSNRLLLGYRAGAMLRVQCFPASERFRASDSLLLARGRLRSLGSLGPEVGCIATRDQRDARAKLPRPPERHRKRRLTGRGHA